MDMNTNGNLAYQIELEEEIIGGEVVMMAPATLNHTRIVRNITRIFDTYLQGKPCEYFPDGAGLCLEDETEEYKPDGMVVCDQSKTRDNSAVYGSPDLVVEVLSPSTAKNDRGHKRDVYERHGVREYWIVSPTDLSVEQYVLENGRFTLRDVYQKFTAAALAGMREKERAAFVTEFSCGIFPDLTISLHDIFGRVVVR